MIVIENLESLSHCPPYVVAALGTFDGVHLGHQEILKRVLSRAQKVGGTSTVFTFISHPWRVVDPVRAPKLITPWELKMEILRVWGIKLLVAIDFTKALAETGAREFVKHLLVDRFCVKDLFVGFDFAFGRGREGNPQVLERLGEEFGFRVEILPAVTLDGKVVSSTLIRSLLEGGKVSLAARFLGRPYLVRGRVIHGKGRGHELGFPTANLEPSFDLLIPDGVYVGWAYWKGSAYPGMINVGYRPTFAEGERKLEVHLFDFSKGLYGEELILTFWDRLREERCFKNSEELVAQLARDKEDAMRILAYEGEPYKNWTLQPWIPVLNRKG